MTKRSKTSMPEFENQIKICGPVLMSIVHCFAQVGHKLTKYKQELSKETGIDVLLDLRSIHNKKKRNIQK